MFVVTDDDVDDAAAAPPPDPPPPPPPVPRRCDSMVEENVFNLCSQLRSSRQFLEEITRTFVNHRIGLFCCRPCVRRHFSKVRVDVLVDLVPHFCRRTLR